MTAATAVLLTQTAVIAFLEFAAVHPQARQWL